MASHNSTWIRLRCTSFWRGAVAQHKANSNRLVGFRRFTLRAALTLAFCLVLGPAWAREAASERPALTEMMHKHKAKVESWTVVTRTQLAGGGQRYAAVVLSSGRMMGLPGNLVNGCTLEMPAGSYTFDANLLVPPFESADHNHKRLDERFGKNTLRWDAEAEAFQLKSTLWDSTHRWQLAPVKPHLVFDDVARANGGDRRFDWYLVPRVVGAHRTPSSEDTSPADGYVQQFWGSPAGQNADWFVVHLDSGHDLILTKFTTAAAAKPWLPGDYLVLSDPEGKATVHRDIEYTAERRWTEPGSDPLRRYAVEVSIQVEAIGLRLRIKAFRDNQFGSIAGHELYVGFAEVTGELAGARCSGWAYMSPVADNDGYDSGAADTP